MTTSEVTDGPDDASESLSRHLLAAGKLRPDTLAQALRMERHKNEPLSRLLIKLGVVSERDVAVSLADIHAAPLLERGDYPQQRLANYSFSTRFLRESEVLPLADAGDAIDLAMADPGDTYALESIRLICNKPVRPRTAVRSELLATIDSLYGGNGLGDAVAQAAALRPDKLEQWQDRVSDAPVIRFVNELIRDAVGVRASDIHLEPFETDLKVRYRIDGSLRAVRSLPRDSAAAITARIKLLAQLDLAERRRPQGGRFQIDIDGSRVDMRIATMPVHHGENLVLRILDRGDTRLTLAELGFDRAVTEPLELSLGGGQGMLLVTGPTGSGKTTTLYAALDKLNLADRKLITVEDPIEYQIDGVNQIQTKPEIGLSFASALRSVLRLDPDIIMVGEIRDPETAAVAIQAGMTGHLVLSTLHTNDALSAVTRLMDMGVEPYLIASTVTAVLAQRLVRKLCPHCRLEQATDESTRALITQELQTTPPDRLFIAGAGCSQCNGSGFHGRLAIGELLRLDQNLTHRIAHAAGPQAFKQIAEAAGLRTMRRDGLVKALGGDTSVAEVMRHVR